MHFQELKNSLTQDSTKSPIMRDSKGMIRLFDYKNNVGKKEESGAMADKEDLENIRQNTQAVVTGVENAVKGTVKQMVAMLEKILKQEYERNQLRNSQKASAAPAPEAKDPTTSNKNKF